MKKVSLVFIFLMIFSAGFAQIKPAKDQPYLVDHQGKPFFWLGDTAWELIHRLNKKEIEAYFKKRSAQGYNVIQTVALAELNGLTVPNRNGDLPLIDQDPAKPNEAYFKWVDWVVQCAQRHDLQIALLPTWGDKIKLVWGPGPVVFNPENAYAYGKFIGERYKDQPNIIYVLGGDRNMETPEELATVNAMAKGIQEHDNGQHMMTYHPRGGYAASMIVKDAKWLDLDMLQTGHWRKRYPTDSLIAEVRQPNCPLLDGEPCYEDHPIQWKPEIGFFHALDIRQSAYRSVFAGACGHTYGHHGIWQMWQKGREPISSVEVDWKHGLKAIGGGQMQYLKKLMEQTYWYELKPDHLMTASGDSLQTLGSDQYLLIYQEQSKDFTANIDGSPLSISVFDPETGKSKRLQNHLQSNHIKVNFPKKYLNRDAVIVINLDTNSL